jgi:hypothetical protein
MTPREIVYFAAQIIDTKKYTVDRSSGAARSSFGKGIAEYGFFEKKKIFKDTGSK